MFKSYRRLTDLTFNPQSRDFVAMGYGIEERFGRCHKFWQKHLEYSKEFQRRALSEIESIGKVAVLGAGRLYDLDPLFLLQKFNQLHFFDADPSVGKVWKKLIQENESGKRVQGTILDLTGSIASWTSKLEEFLKIRKVATENELAEFLDGLVLGERPALSGYDCVISLNLLSEIPVYWRNRAEDSLLKRIGLDTNERGRYNGRLQEALERTMYALESQHLSALSESQAKVLLVLRDSRYFYYEQDRANWQEESASLLDSEIRIAGYAVTDQDSWLWHIAPQGIEQSEYGIINLVNALKFERADL